MGRANREVLTHMRQNGGVLTRATALAMGMASSTLQGWVEIGHLVPVGYGVYVLPGVLDSERTQLLAAAVALDAVVSHESAGRLHGLDVPAADPTVSVPVRRSNRFLGVTVHQLTDLHPDHTIEMAGLPVTNGARTIIDLAATALGTRRLAAILDQAVRMSLTTYDEVADLLGELARKGKPGVKRMRNILTPRLTGNHVSDSALESRLFDVIVDAGLPPPITQFRPPWLRKVNGRVDLAYPEQEILIEGDSRRWHGTPEGFQLDRTRDNLAALAGWISLRYTWEDITRQPERIVADITEALSARRRAGYPALLH